MTSFLNMVVKQITKSDIEQKKVTNNFKKHIRSITRPLASCDAIMVFLFSRSYPKLNLSNFVRFSWLSHSFRSLRSTIDRLFLLSTPVLAENMG